MHLARLQSDHFSTCLYLPAGMIYVKWSGPQKSDFVVHGSVDAPESVLNATARHFLQLRRGVESARPLKTRLPSASSAIWLSPTPQMVCSTW